MQATQEKRIEFAEQVTYVIGKTTAVINCTFRKNDSETVTTILSRLILAELENN